MSKYLGAIVIPTLNEAENIEANLKSLQSLRDQWLIIVSDGGSEDNTPDVAARYSDYLINSPKGRAVQLNEGALKARQISGNQGVLVFLHADTRLPENFSNVIAEFLASNSDWGRFDVTLSGQAPSLRIIESMINWRSRTSGIATGDQAMFFKASFFWNLCGFPVLPLMEDVEMSARAKRRSKPLCSRHRVITSSRKWEQQGIWKTVVLMWFYRAAFYAGVSAAQIHRWYYR